MRDFTVGFGGASIITWLATRRLHNLFRFNLAVGAAAACGLWRFSRSVESSVEHVLSLEGSRIQKELANILLRRYHDNPWVHQRLSKYFYTEEVYDDSSVDRPKLQWRFRNFFGDPNVDSQSTAYSEETDSLKNVVEKTTTATKTKTKPRQVHANESTRDGLNFKVNAVEDDMENPFDIIFGNPGSAETIPSPEKPSTSSRRRARKEKRSRRRHGRHHPEESDI